MKTLTNIQQDTPLKPEWVRPAQATQIFGIGRTKIYELIADGKIKSASIKARGATKGTRLISYDSLSTFINSQIEGDVA
jgi:hypothetical protein